MSGRPMSSEGATEGVSDAAGATADYTAPMDWLDQIKWDRDGLVPVIAQEQGSNDILMFAHSGLSIAMGNADPQVTNGAHRINAIAFNRETHGRSRL